MVSTSLAEFIDFYAVTFSPKFLCSFKIYHSLYVLFLLFPFFNLPILLRSSLFKISQFLIPFFSPKNVPISPTTRSKVGVQSHAKSPSKPKKHGARQNKRISVPSDSYTLANSPTTIAQETTKATGKTRWVNTRFPLSLSLFLSSISPCNKLAIVLAETTSINICG